MRPAGRVTAVNLDLPRSRWMPLPWYVLLSLVALVICLAVYATIAYLVRPLLARIDVDREALLIESLHGHLDNQVIGSLQLGRELQTAQATGKPVAYSVAFASALVARTADSLHNLNIDSLVDRKKATRILCIAGAILLCFAGLVAARPNILAQRITRVREAYGTMIDRIYPPAISAASAHHSYIQTPVTMGQRIAVLDVSSDDKPLSLVRGTEVFLGVHVPTPRHKTARVILTNSKTDEITIHDLTLDADGTAVLKPSDPMVNGDAKAKNPLSGDESFTYQFENGDIRTPVRSIVVGDVPVISNMNIDLTYPSYTRMPTRTLIGKVSRISALKGTQVLVSITSTVDLDSKRSFVSWPGNQIQELSITGRFAHFFFIVDRSTPLSDPPSIHLTGAMGKEFEMPEPFKFEVVAQEDAPPEVSLILSQKQKTQGRSKDGVPVFDDQTKHFTLGAIATDDYGVTDMTLHYVVDSLDRTRDFPPRDPNGYQESFPVSPSQDRMKHNFTDVFKKLATDLVPGEPRHDHRICHG